MKTYNFWYRLLTYKYYFDVGFGELNYIKYFIAIFGAFSFAEGISLILTFIIAFLYAVICFIFGRWWVLNKLRDIENDVANNFNPFCKDVIKAIKKKNI